MQEQEQKFRVIDYDQQLREEEDMLAREIQENLETVQLAAEQFNQHLHMQTETIETVDDNLDASDASLRAGLDQYTQSRKTAQSKHVSGGTGLGAGAGGALGAGAMAGVVGGPVGILVGGVIGAVFGGVGGRKLGKKLKDRGNKAITKEYIRHEERRAQVLATTRPAVSSKPTARGGLQEARGTEEEEGEEELDSEEADFQAWQRGEDQARPQVRYTGRTSSQRGQQGKPGVEQKEEEGEEETQDFTRFRRRRQNGRNLHSSSSSSSSSSSMSARDALFLGHSQAAAEREGDGEEVEKQEGGWDIALRQAKKTERVVKDNSQILAEQSEKLRVMPTKIDLQEDTLHATDRIHNASSLWGSVKNLFIKKSVPQSEFSKQCLQNDNKLAAEQKDSQQAGPTADVFSYNPDNDHAIQQIMQSVQETKIQAEQQGKALDQHLGILDYVESGLERVDAKTIKQIKRVQKEQSRIF